MVCCQPEDGHGPGGEANGVDRFVRKPVQDVVLEVAVGLRVRRLGSIAVAEEVHPDDRPARIGEEVHPSVAQPGGSVRGPETVDHQDVGTSHPGNITRRRFPYRLRPQDW